MANGIMDIDTQFMLNSMPMDSKAFLPTNVPFDDSYAQVAADMAMPYQDFARDLGYGGDPTKIQGIGSDVRHTVGSAKGKFAVQDYLAENLAIPRDSSLSNFLGNAAIYGSTFAQEIPDAIRNIPEGGIDFYKQPLEDIRANLRATELPYGIKDADLLQYAVATSPSKDMIERSKAMVTGFPEKMIRQNRFPPTLSFPGRPDPNYEYGTVKADDIIPVNNNLLTSGIVNQAFKRAPNEAFQQILDEEYEKGEMMDNVADAPRDSFLSRILDLGKGLGGGIIDAAKGAGNVLSNLGIVGALRNFDNFKNLSPLDRQFILQQAGGNRPNKDKYGYNIRSAFGNYANLVGRKALNAATKTRFGIPLTAMDLYYQNKEKERAAKDRAVLDNYFGGSGAGPSGNRYDGAPTAEAYAAEPTAYSGSS